MKKVCIIILIIIAVSFSFNCSSDKTIIYGRYLTNPDKSLKGNTIQLILVEAPHSNYTYTTVLAKNGTFKIKVKEKGIFTALMGIERYSSENWNFPGPYLSNSTWTYRVDTCTNKKILLDKYLYMTEPLEILCPKSGQTVDENCFIKWQKDVYADGYQISFYTQTDSSKAVQYIDAFIFETELCIKEISKLPIIERFLEAKEARDKMPFVTKNKEITSGNYILQINGFKLIPEENRMIKTTQSNKISIDLIIHDDTKNIELLKMMPLENELLDKVYIK